MKTTITKDQRRARMMERIQQHGETLLDLFPNASERDPVKLCRKLRRLEAKAHRLATKYCNGYAERDGDGQGDLPGEVAIMEAVRRCLGLTREAADECGLFLNCDCRGYALKLDSDFVRGWNEPRISARLPLLYSDWGGYGILAPDLSND